MTEAQWVYALATLLGVAGMWMLLPRRTGGGRVVGAVLMASAVGLWASRLPVLGDWVAQGTFALLAGVTVVAAVATVSLRNPVYCAIWFGMSLLGTAGLMMTGGAQFLAVATIVVYAGAILVTFLFVLMLAGPRGRAPYDRTSSEGLVSAATGIVIVGILSMTVAGVLSGPVEAPDAELAQPHVAQVGAELFGRHLVAVEVAGTLLMAALIGAAVIVAETKPDQQK